MKSGSKTGCFSLSFSLFLITPSNIQLNAFTATYIYICCYIYIKLSVDLYIRPMNVQICMISELTFTEILLLRYIFYFLSFLWKFISKMEIQQYMFIKIYQYVCGLIINSAFIFFYIISISNILLVMQIKHYTEKN